MKGNAMDLNQQVEIAPGVIKTLGDCTKADLLAARDLAIASMELVGAVRRELDRMPDRP